MKPESTTRPDVSTGRRTFILVVVLLAMTVGAMCLNKVAPIATTIVSGMGLSSVGQTGLLISVFTLSGIVLSLPIGTILNRVGCYRMGLLSLLALAVGSLVGAFDVSYPVMLVSRIIEGIGLVCLTTLGPTIVGTVYPDESRGRAMGLLMCFMAFGQIAMLNAGPAMAAAMGWKSVWWVTATCSVILIVVWAFGLRGIDQLLDGLADASSAEPQQDAGEKNLAETLKAVLKNKTVWLASISFMVFIFAEQAAMSYLPSYLVDARGTTEALAGTITSIASLVGIPVGILAGVVCDKLGSRRIPQTVLLVFAAVLYALVRVWPTDLMWLFSLLHGIAVMGEIGVYFSIVGAAVKPSQAGGATGLLNTFQYVGIFLSAVVFGAVVDALGWNMAFLALAPACAVAAALVFVDRDVA